VGLVGRRETLGGERSGETLGELSAAAVLWRRGGGQGAAFISPLIRASPTKLPVYPWAVSLGLPSPHIENLSAWSSFVY
jgi:hypothetical protein